MFSNEDNVDKQTVDEDLFPFWKKSESDVMDDLFLAIQNIVAGTATISNILSENCFQYKIHLTEDFPVITLQYEMKPDINIETICMMPVVVDENSGIHQMTDISNEVTDEKLENSFPFYDIKGEIPRDVCVSDLCEVITDKKLASFDCSQNIRNIVSHSEINICNTSPSDFLNKSDSSVNSIIDDVKKMNVMLDNYSQLTTSPTKEQDGSYKNINQNKRSKGIVKDGIKRQEERSEENKLSCSYCGKSFSKNSGKLQHERTHTGEKPFTCEDCGKCFARLFKLKEHQRIHSGEKPFKCETCGKAFTQSGSLNSHKKIHTGEGLFTCDVCGKKFTQSGSLNTHKRIHTDEKHFTCEICGKAFTQSGSLKTHKKIHTGEKSFQCDECGKCFLHSFSFAEHKRIHSGEKPFKCEECGKCFPYLAKLTWHKKNSHK